MQGKKIILRALEPQDVTLLYAWENDPETWVWGDRRWPVSLEDVCQLIKNSDQDVWQTRQMRLMIERRADGCTVGCIDIFDFDPLNAHACVGVLIDKDYRLRGYAREALELIEAFMKETLRVHVIRADVEETNVGSCALFRSAGYRQTGRLEDWIRRGEGYFAELVFLKRV